MLENRLKPDAVVPEVPAADPPPNSLPEAEPVPEMGATPSPVDRLREAFADPRGENTEVFNGFVSPDHVWTPDPCDMDGIHGEARSAFTTLLNRANSQAKSGLLTLLGDAGTGKTHLLRAWHSQVHESRRGYCGYVPLSPTANYEKLILEGLIQSLDQPYRQDEKSGLHRLAKKLFASIERIDSEDREDFRGDKLTQVDLVDCVSRFTKNALETLHFQHLTGDSDLISALLWLLPADGAAGKSVLKWLKCDELSPEESKELGGLKSRTTDTAPREIIAGLARVIAAVARAEGGPDVQEGALVLLVDGLERVLERTTKKDEDRTQVFQLPVGTLLRIVEQVPTIAVVVSCLTSSFQEAKPLLTPAQSDRVDNADLITLATGQSTPELRAVTAKRLQELLQQVDPTLPTTESSELFPDAFLERHAGKTPRAFLRVLDKHHKACVKRGEWFDPPTEVEGEAKPEPAVSPAPARAPAVVPPRMLNAAPATSKAKPSAFRVRDWRLGRGAIVLGGWIGRSLRRGYIRWPVLLALTYALTWGTMWGINTWATSATEREFVEHLRWLKSKDEQENARPVPATAELIKPDQPKPVDGQPPPKESESKRPDQLNPAALGVQGGVDKLPEKLKADDKKTWQRDDELSHAIRKELFKKDFEDSFDKFYAKYLLIPMQPLQREKKVREDRGYTELLSGVENKDEREQMLRHFSNVYGEFMRLLPCRVIRWVNGWVQVTAFATFWLAILIVIYQSGLVYWERRQAKRFFPFDGPLADGTPLVWDAPLRDEDRLTSTVVEQEVIKLNDPELGEHPGVAVQMLREVYESYARGEVTCEGVRDRAAATVALESVTQRCLRQTDSNMASLVYLGWSLPSLGFIGTVLGLGTALLTAGDMVTPVSELQRDAIQTVSIYLGRAFDKTFVALLLSLVMMALVYAVRHAEEAVVLQCQERVARGVIPRLFG